MMNEWMESLKNIDEIQMRGEKKAQIKRADTYRFRQRLEIELPYVLNIQFAFLT